MAEIRSAHEALAATLRFRKPADAAWLLPLHSSVAGDQQRRVFADPPPGVRKVVLATNIAGAHSAQLRNLESSCLDLHCSVGLQSGQYRGPPIY